MAGLEQLEIHSKVCAFATKLVGPAEEANADSRTSCGGLRLRRDIPSRGASNRIRNRCEWRSCAALNSADLPSNFGLFKHPRAGGSGGAPSDDSLTLDTGSDKNRRPSGSKNDASTCQDQLRAKGFISISWYGKCEADKVSVGTYPVTPGQGGMYGLVFDNTFSKQISKTATFVLLTYPSNAPPRTTHQLQNAPTSAATNISKSQSPRIGALASESMDSLEGPPVLGSSASRGNSVNGRDGSDISSATYHVGVLSKRRRKRGQGYARRFFSLDFASCTLSYYHSRHSSALRGAIPLSLAAIAADERRREINIDSGAEIWHLKAGNAKDFDEWTKALEKASNVARDDKIDLLAPPAAHLTVQTNGLAPAIISHEEEREWAQIESLVSRIVGTRDAVRRLSKDTAPVSSSRRERALSVLGLPPANGSPSAEDGGDYFGGDGATPREKRPPFWKRMSSVPSTSSGIRSGMSSQLAVPLPTTVPTAPANTSRRGRHGSVSHDESSIHEHCTAMLNDLDAVLSDFSALLASSKRRRTVPPMSASRLSRHSIDSTSTGEFYDAEVGDADHSQVMMIDRHSEDNQISEEDEFITDASSISSAEDEDGTSHLNGTAALFPLKPKSLDPLPISSTIKRRKGIPAATVLPPSLIGFLRKNVGKDLSTISMPVSANEPLSLLQRVAEQLEYAQLLDKAASHKSSDHRLLCITAFAVSQFSVNRARERAIRKPFNPMLGETFELVRSEEEVPGGFRLLVEKVSHRPVRMACQADSAKWSFSQSPAPNQKFWGKSAELITEGRVRLVLRLSDGNEELYSWNTATAFLRNVVMGEKYVEPVGNMTVTNETTGAKASIEFKAKGMFGGRSEDVGVECYSSDGSNTGFGLVGTWTNSLKVVEAGKQGKEIWRVGELVEDAANTYGMTTFAASLNEITSVEKGKLPATDTRLRPDQRAAEMGDLDDAEELKSKLEEKQRVRRGIMEEQGREYKPRWFVKVEGGDEDEEVWKIKGGKEGYWEERSKGVWTGVENILSP